VSVEIVQLHGEVGEDADNRPGAGSQDDARIADPTDILGA